jgi:hypothetical protein
LLEAKGTPTSKQIENMKDLFLLLTENRCRRDNREYDFLCRKCIVQWSAHLSVLLFHVKSSICIIPVVKYQNIHSSSSEKGSMESLLQLTGGKHTCQIP